MSLVLGLHAGQAGVAEFLLARCRVSADEFLGAAGRTIIGAGGGMVDQDGKPLTARRLREQGGMEQHRILKNEADIGQTDETVDPGDSRRANGLTNHLQS